MLVYRLVVLRRHPELRLERPLESRGHHAHDLVRQRVDRDRATHDTRVASEALLPQRVAEHQDARLAGLMLLGRERSAGERRNLQCLEEAVAHLCANQPRWLPGMRQHEAMRVVRGRGVERPRALLHVEKVRRTEDVFLALPELE